MPNGPYATIILAAGNSSRLGEPKQLLEYQGKKLIRHMAESALAIMPGKVTVVTGSNAALIAEALNGLDVRMAYNAQWATGMSSSIHAGITALLAHDPHTAGALLTVSDQPFVTPALLAALIGKFETAGSGIVACAYEATLGTPVFFSKPYFNELLQLTGTEGAKKLLKKFAGDVASFPFEDGNIDIDTREDYQRLLNRGGYSR